MKYSYMDYMFEIFQTNQFLQQNVCPLVVCGLNKSQPQKLTFEPFSANVRVRPLGGTAA